MTLRWLQRRKRAPRMGRCNRSSRISYLEAAVVDGALDGPVGEGRRGRLSLLLSVHLSHLHLVSLLTPLVSFRLALARVRVCVRVRPVARLVTGGPALLARAGAAYGHCALVVVGSGSNGECGWLEQLDDHRGA